jgi:hypothetical protein
MRKCRCVQGWWTHVLVVCGVWEDGHGGQGAWHPVGNECPSDRPCRGLEQHRC